MSPLRAKQLAYSDKLQPLNMNIITSVKINQHSNDMCWHKTTNKKSKQSKIKTML